jgi:hypothetical protein
MRALEKAPETSQDLRMRCACRRPRGQVEDERTIMIPRGSLPQSPPSTGENSTTATTKPLRRP